MTSSLFGFNSFGQDTFGKVWTDFVGSASIVSDIAGSLNVIRVFATYSILFGIDVYLSGEYIGKFWQDNTDVSTLWQDNTDVLGPWEDVIIG